jgi:hypothetical protein
MPAGMRHTAIGGATLLRRDEAHRARASGPRPEGCRAIWSARRGHAFALWRSCTPPSFFWPAFFPSLISKADRAVLFGSVVQCLPATISIAVSLVVAVVVTNPRLSPRAAAAMAVVFEIASSYGIAAAELLGLSWWQQRIHG